MGYGMDKRYYVYILAGKRNGTLYTGMTSDIRQRMRQHKGKDFEGFTSKYGVDKLVWYEMYDNPRDAIAREKQIKKWRRVWKLKVIEELNPEWKDLSDEEGV